MPRKKYLAPTKKQSLSSEKNYRDLLQELKSILAKGQYAAYKAVDNIRVQTFWQLGERIVREELKSKNRADYGKYLVDNLAVDLGIKKQRLYEIVKFYRIYPIVRTVSGQLSWSHYLELTEIEHDKARAFYQNHTILHSWSVRELRKQIKSNLYEKTPKHEIEDVFKAKLPAIVDTQAVFKSSYDFQFIELHPQKKEKDLEDKILSNIELFLKELGEDFCFVSRQTPIKIGGDTHHIDLVLYHRAIPCNVLVDLKIGKLKDNDITQMNKYVAYYRRHKQYAHEKDTIGLIICREANKELISYALDGLEEKIFIREYKVKLPSDAKIKKAIKNL
jgi:predicted nuclease of restriction endonuclease-like (RecB) superfamily